MAMQNDWFDTDSADKMVRTEGTNNCPNCGAIIESDECPYCGTLFIDVACLDADKPCFMKIKHNDEIYIFKVQLISTSMHSEPMTFYLDNRPALMTRGPTELTLDFIVVD